MSDPKHKEQDIAGELSRARGEIDAAHVVLTGAGVDCPEAPLQDRIARYVGETETKLEHIEPAESAQEPTPRCSQCHEPVPTPPGYWIVCASCVDQANAKLDAGKAQP